MDPPEQKPERIDKLREILSKIDDKGVAEIAGIAQVHREMMLNVQVLKVSKALESLAKILDQRLVEILKHDKVVAGLLREISGKMPEQNQ